MERVNGRSFGLRDEADLACAPKSSLGSALQGIRLCFVRPHSWNGEDVLNGCVVLKILAPVGLHAIEGHLSQGSQITAHGI